MSDDKGHDAKGHGDGGHGHGSGGGHGGGGHGGGGHGGGGGHEEHEGAPEWLISFADNTALMMGFFVILLAMAMNKPSGKGEGDSPKVADVITSDRMLDLAISIREAFHNPVDLSSTDPKDLPLIQRMIERGESDARAQGKKGTKDDVDSPRESDYHSPAGTIPFDENSTTLSNEGIDSVRQLMKLIRGHNLIVEVRGHVSAAEAFARSDRGMQLSFDRARSVGQAISAEGIPWNQLRLIALADGDRIMPIAYEPSEHKKNQRVEIVVTDEVTPEPGIPLKDQGH